MLAFNFWQQQRVTKKNTAAYLGIYLLLLAAGGAAFEAIVRFALPAENDLIILEVGAPGVLFVICCGLVGGCYYYCYTSATCRAMAQSTFGAVPIQPDSNLENHKMLFNIAEEMAIASGLPIPEILLIPVSEINSLTLGSSKKNYAILITEGALNSLSRDELQVMVGYEMAHIKEGTLQLNMRLSAMLMSFYFMMNISYRLLSTHRQTSSSSKNNKKGNSMVIIAAALMIAGGLLYVLGAILQRFIAHQRVYLADASAVQFTRNTPALYALLSKIKMQNKNELPRIAEGLSHFYLSSNSATHPSLEERLLLLNCGSTATEVGV